MVANDKIHETYDRRERGFNGLATYAQNFIPRDRVAMSVLIYRIISVSCPEAAHQCSRHATEDQSSGSGLSLVSGAKGKMARPIKKIAHMVMAE